MIPFVRPVRTPPPASSGEPLPVPAPPELPRASGETTWTALLPAFATGGTAVFFLAPGTGANPIMRVMGVVMLLSTAALVAAQLARARSGVAGRLFEDRLDHLERLAAVREEARRAAAAQRGAALFRHPDPAGLWSRAADPARLWERRPEDPDFGEVRVGTGSLPADRVLVEEDARAASARLDPFSAEARRRLTEAHRTVPGLPLTVRLTAWPRIAFTGPGGRAVLRAALAQAVVGHSPDELAVAVLAPPDRAGADWDWVKWLPHARELGADDGAGPARLFLTGAGTEAEGLAERASGRRVLAVVDEMPGALPDLPEVTWLLVGGSAGEGGLAVEAGADGRLTVRDPSGSAGGTADTLGIAAARGLARLLAPRFPVGPDTGAGQAVGFAELAALGGGERLRVPIGLTPAGAPVLLDLREAALGGDGPHGLCVGATGSGKSELLRTLVLGLAVGHSAEEVNLLLVDFKGGATFAGLARLPHTSALITNLERESTLVARMAEAVTGELQRRQEMLRTAGVASREEYAAARAADPSLPPLPSLLVVVDEFGELLDAHPDFAALFDRIGRIGRSLGVHLLLASQRLEEGRLRGLESALSYRIGLRTLSEAESRAALGVPDAFRLPADPGRGLLRTGADAPVPFRAGYASAPLAPAADPAPHAAPREPVLFTAAPVPLPAARRPEADAPPPAASLPPAAGPTGPTVLDAVVEGLAARGGPEAHRVWLPPLEEAEAVGDLLPRGLRAGLEVPVGVVDRPLEQRRSELVCDFSGAGGHGLVVGGPRSGKSTLLATVVAGLCLSRGPGDVRFFCLDMGGGPVSELAGLVQVAGTAGRRDAEAVRRTAAEVRALLDAREAGRPDPDGRRPEVFLVVDGWAALQREYEEVADDLVELAARGLAHGVHLLVSASRYAELRPALKDQLLNRLELRLAEPLDTEAADRAAARAVPEGAPGRGLTREGLHFLAARPIPAADAGSGPDALADAVRERWAGQAPAPAVRMLPTLLPADRLPDEVPSPAPSGSGRGGPDAPTHGSPPLRTAVGVDEAALAPAAVDLTEDPHLLVFGDAESGKTGLLRLLADRLTRRHPPGRLRVLAADARRSLLDAVPETHRIGYAAGPAALAEQAAETAEALRPRLPGPGVTASQLRDRSWWTGPEVLLLVDDYDLLALAAPLDPLLEMLPQAKDVGLHLVVARRTAGASRALYEPVFQRLRECATPGVLLSGEREEGALVGEVRPERLPAGRCRLVDRRGTGRLVQLAWAGPVGPAGPAEGRTVEVSRDRW